MNKLKIFTWHIHGSYLYYLTQTNCEFYIPYKPDMSEGYVGKGNGKNFSWGNNLQVIPVDEVKYHNFDIILFQSKKNYLEDQYEIFSDKQRALPKIYLEHDPPRKQPTDTKHSINDPNMLIVHVTHFNNLMWDCGQTQTIVIEHGTVIPPNVHYTGKLSKGIVMVNNLSSEKRGKRRMGYDIFQYVKNHVPVDLIGMGSKEIGGLGEIPYNKLPAFLAPYRFFLNPIRYTSLGLSVCEAMMLGMPIVGLATTEMAVTIENDISGYVHTNIDLLIEKMKLLLEHPEKANELGRNARKLAQQKFNIHRFAKDWETVFQKTKETFG